MTTRQAEQVGVKAWLLADLERRGHLRRTHRGVYLFELGRASHPQEELISAWLAIDGDRLPWKRADDVAAIVSHASAAALQELSTIIPTLPEITQARQKSRRDEMRLHVARFTREDWEWRALEGVRLPVSTPARTIVDLLLGGEELDYLERATRKAFPLPAEANAKLEAAARRRLQRPGRLLEDVHRLCENAWSVAT